MIVIEREVIDLQTVKRLLVMSDIHGQIDAFNALLDKVKYKMEEDLLFLLGDYVDRGQNPRSCIQKARELEAQGAIPLKGNHEDMMEKALAGENLQALSHWASNGGTQTLASYGLLFEDIYHSIRDGSLSLPDQLLDDLQWIQKLNVYAETEHYFFVHAGVDPQKAINETDDQTFLWIRSPFFDGYHGDKTVIFGHTPTMNLHDTNDVYFGTNNIIGIDGGCVFGGQLNCLELPSKVIYSV
ncbi:metallophosphoesterase family protein [Sporolactobacillus kofuensis]|uniref:Metallophosphoesterase family protein n=1 Tax=Sporolactobacillus kofuensis TaxID=269672 RepID=A0ABW1WBY3_9BACL|nr:metallophosphoesterase family protein [Sporolactobacillus kofuensis]MCO7174557.1 serine/threonine protein phosphatase [Sporolactobacillus kofuensis]